MILRARYGAAAQDAKSDGRGLLGLAAVRRRTQRRDSCRGHMVNLVEPYRYNRVILTFLRGADAPH